MESLASASAFGRCGSCALDVSRLSRQGANAPGQPQYRPHCTLGHRLLKQIVRPETGPRQIMDLGMRSSGMEGATRAGWLVAGLFVLFLSLMATIGVDNAAIAFAVLMPLLFLSGWQHWFTAVATGGIIATWTYGFMTYFMAVIWPEPVLAGW